MSQSRCGISWTCSLRDPQVSSHSATFEPSATYLMGSTADQQTPEKALRMTSGKKTLKAREGESCLRTRKQLTVAIVLHGKNMVFSSPVGF